MISADLFPWGRWKFFLLVFLTVVFSSCGQRGGSRAALRVGMDLTYPPFQTFVEIPPGVDVKPDGLHKQIDGVIWRIDGASVKLADACAQELGRPLEIVPMKFQDLIPGVNSGRIDLIVASMSITEKRRQLIDFSEPYAQTGLGMLVVKDSPISSLEDLRVGGRKLVVRQSTVAEEFVRAQVPVVPCEVLQENAMCLRAVMDNPNVAFVHDYLWLWKMQNRLLGRAQLLPKLLDHETWGIGVRKGDSVMLRRVNTFLTRFRAGGGFERLTDTYLPGEKKFLALQGLPPLFR